MAEWTGRARGGCAGWGGRLVAPVAKITIFRRQRDAFPLGFSVADCGEGGKKNAVGLRFRLFFIDLQCRTAAEGRRLTPLRGLAGRRMLRPDLLTRRYGCRTSVQENQKKLQTHLC